MAEAERRGRARASQTRPIIKAARPDEYAFLGELTVRAYGTLPGRDHPAHRGYEPHLRDVAGRAERSVVLVAELDGVPVGTVTYVSGPGPDAETDDPEAAEIRMLAVAPEARGRGVGEALVRACIARARTDGRRRLVLHTRLEMAAALRLYDRLGFVRAPGLDFTPVEGIDLLGYALELGKLDAPPA
jgi:ribosomal protein S18 acetylase RimI-like enzyme